MARSATAPSVSFPTIPVLDVDIALASLPAEARAQVAWAKKPIENGLARLSAEPLTDDLVAQVTDEMWKPFGSLWQAFGKIVGTNQEEWRARFVDDFKREEDQLAAFIEEDDSRDTLRWILGLLHSLLNLSLSVPAEFIGQVDEETFARASAEEDFKPYIRSLFVLMAAAETRRVGGDPERARDLLDVAFLELSKFRATMRKLGVSLTPFPFESVDERRRGLLESADRLREALTDEDWRLLEQGRLRDFR
jgi:hypothetical protein